MTKVKDPTKKAEESDKKKYINQSDIPAYSLEEALKIPNTIIDNFGGKPTAPFQVAMAMNTTQASSYWRIISGAAIAYGLTDGGYNSVKIGLLELATKIISPTEEGSDITALVEAALKPTVLKKFFEKYNNAKFPKDTIAENVLKIEFNVPVDKTKKVLDLIKANGNYVGIIHETKTGPYVFVDQPSSSILSTKQGKETNDEGRDNESDENGKDDVPEDLLKRMNLKKPVSLTIETPLPNEKQKVFISHGKNNKVVEQLKEILTYGQFEVVISIEKESTAISVPDKVFSDMRSCKAAVIHVEGERELIDKEGNAHQIINENVLIEIGAAMALYGKKFILLCEESLKLPSNLQGLYRCNYEGKELSYNATMKLLKTFNEFRNS